MNSRRFMLALPEAIIAAEAAIPEEGRRKAMTQGQGAGARRGEVVVDESRHLTP